MSLIYHQENNQMNKRKLAKDRREEILAVAVRLSALAGYRNVTRNQIAEVVGLTPQAIQHHIGTVANMRRDIMRKAIADENLTVIAQGMANKDEHALKAPDDLLGRARAAL